MNNDFDTKTSAILVAVAVASVLGLAVIGEMLWSLVQ
jgi:hypothetical protein